MKVKSLKNSILKIILTKINSNKKRPNLHIKKSKKDEIQRILIL